MQTTVRPNTFRPSGGLCFRVISLKRTRRPWFSANSSQVVHTRHNADLLTAAQRSETVNYI
jgi:hypothetical protein